MISRPALRNLIAFAALSIIMLGAEQRGVFTGANQTLADMRMAHTPLPSNGSVVFVAVDAASLAHVGTWPWSRSVHARLLDTLTDHGARDVLFDFDFAFPADATGDRAFETALDRAGGFTYLPVFRQTGTVTDASIDISNRPLPGFADRSWPALVNVEADAEGRVRYYPMGTTVGDEFVSSAGALLSGHMSADTISFAINYRIDAGTIPIISAADLLRGNVPADLFQGRAAVVGAAAIELGDRLTVPVQGVLPGPAVHILATETLSRGLVPKWLDPTVMAGVLFLLLGAAKLTARGSPWRLATALALGLTTVEVAAFLTFRTASVVLPTAMLYPAIVGYGLVHLAGALRSSNWMLRKTGTDYRNTLSLLKRVFNDSTDGIIILAEDGRVLRQSRRATTLFERDETGQMKLPKILVSQALSALAAPVQPDIAPLRTTTMQSNGSKRTLEYRITVSVLDDMRKEASPRVATLTVRDITQQIEQEQHIAYLSNYDERSGALRRAPFLKFLALRLERDGGSALFVISISQLKTVNLKFGRKVGDALLQEVVTRLETSDRGLSVAARLGGSSFAIFSETDISPDDAGKLAAWIRDQIAAPYLLSDARAQIDVHIGYLPFDRQGGLSETQLLDMAEEALDQAKQSGLSFASHNAAMAQRQRRARAIEAEMVEALRNEEFYVTYQPQHRLSDGALTGAEALVRWDSPTLGGVGPDEFIEIAESTGFIAELGAWVLDRAVCEASQMAADMTIAVNVSALQMVRGDLTSNVRSVLRAHGFPAKRLCLELTETVLASSADSLIETMQDLGFLGVTWALDDFGTGYSSMAYLSRMPLDKIKLDKSFTMGLGFDATAGPILHSTGELCRGLGVKLLCEGVETAAQLAILKSEGCDEGQGYYFGKPMRLGAFLEYSVGNDASRAEDA